MNQEKSVLLEQFMKNELLLARKRLKEYIVSANGNKLLKRPLFYRIQKYIDEFLKSKSRNRWVTIHGLRGTGKTTLLAQIYFHLLEERKIETEDIIYLSLDSVTKLLKSNLYESIQAFEDLEGNKLEERKRPLFIFIDEAHYDKNWDISCKNIFDRTTNTFLLVTGSSALNLHSADTARRVQREHLFPLSFTEYIMLKTGKKPFTHLKEKIEEAIFHAKNAEEAKNKLEVISKQIKEYWKNIDEREINRFIVRGTLAFALEFDEHETFKRIITILEKVVYEDIPSIKEFEKTTLNKIWNLLFVLATSHDSINLESLSQKIGIAKPTLISTISILEKAEIILPIKAYGRAAKQIRKSPKYTFIAPILKSTLLSEAGQLDNSQETYGKLFEDVVASYLYRTKETKRSIEIKYDSSRGGSDFIIINKISKNKIPLEVSYGAKTERQVLQTMKKIKANYGILISKEPLIKVMQNVLFLPKEIFLLL